MVLRSNNIRILVLMVGAIVLSASGCREFSQPLDEYMTKAQKAWGFSGSVLVAVDGNVILSEGYGMADRAFGSPNTPQTKFYIGSITKQITAAAILKLQDRGLLHVHDTISNYLPDYGAPFADRVTIHQLLTHTSGIPNYTNLPEVVVHRTRDVTPAEIMNSIKEWSLQFEPGAAMDYSNSNYVILGAVIEAVSGQSYEAYLHKAFFKPLGMSSTGYGRREIALPERAEGYTRNDSLEFINAVETHLSLLHSAGALYSTTEDMLRWDQALYEAKVLSRRAITTMLTPHRAQYGYGWVIDTLYGRTHTYHGGFLDGFNCTFERWLDDRLCIAVFSNDDESPVKKIARSLAAIVFGEPFDPPEIKVPVSVNEELFADYTGVYQISDTVVRTITYEEGSLYSRLTGLERQQLLPEAIDTFYFVSDNTRRIIFNRDERGRVDRLLLYDEGLYYPAAKLPAEQAEAYRPRGDIIRLLPSILSRYTGLYSLESLFGEDKYEMNLTITQTDDHLTVTSPGIGRADIYPLSERRFIHKEVDFGIRFEIDDSGRVTGCTIQMGNAEVEGAKVH